MSASVRLSIRFRKSGNHEVEAITERGCSVQVQPQPANDDMVILDIDLVALRVGDGGEPIGDERDGNHAVPDGCESPAGIRDRHVIRVGNGDFGPLRVISHDVSPYDWRLVNFGGSQQYSIRHQETLAALYDGVQQQPLNEGIDYQQALSNLNRMSAQAFPDITEGQS